MKIYEKLQTTEKFIKTQASLSRWDASDFQEAQVKKSACDKLSLYIYLFYCEKKVAKYIFGVVLYLSLLPPHAGLGVMNDKYESLLHQGAF